MPLLVECDIRVDRQTLQRPHQSAIAVEGRAGARVKDLHDWNAGGPGAIDQPLLLREIGLQPSAFQWHVAKRS